MDSVALRELDWSYLVDSSQLLFILLTATTRLRAVSLPDSLDVLEQRNQRASHQHQLDLHGSLVSEACVFRLSISLDGLAAPMLLPVVLPRSLLLANWNPARDDELKPLNCYIRILKTSRLRHMHTSPLEFSHRQRLYSTKLFLSSHVLSAISLSDLSVFSHGAWQGICEISVLLRRLGGISVFIQELCGLAGWRIKGGHDWAGSIALDIRDLVDIMILVISLVKFIGNSNSD